jgi:hypothetical protein
MLKNENILNITLYIIFLVIYSIILDGKFEIIYPIMYALYTSTWIKSIYDIKNETGYEKMYVYTKETNQKLRYLVFFVLTFFMITGHKFLLCNQLQLCS